MDPKIILTLMKQYALNDTQRQLCDTLQVPHFAWSIYESKKYNLIDIWTADRRENNSIYNKLFENQIKAMNLSHNEQLFIMILEKIIQRTSYFVFYSPTSLQDACISKISQLVMHKDRKEIEAFLPERILSRVEDQERLLQHFPMPYDDHKTVTLILWLEARQARKMPQEVSMPVLEEMIHFSDTEYDYKYDYFRKVDGCIFSRKYAIWFQTSRLVREKFQKSQVKVVHFYFTRNNLRHDLCINCMKLRLSLLYGVKHGTFERFFYNHGEGPFFINHDIQNPYNWCLHCRRIPLFQILMPEEYKILYAHSPETQGWFPIKVERFI